MPSSPSPVTHVRDYARTTLRPRHQRTVRAFAEAFFFDETAPFPEGKLDAIVPECDRFVSPASKTLRFGLVVILDVMRLLPLLVIGRFALFEDVPVKDRVRMLEKMEASRFVPFTLFVVAYKTILAVLFFEDPRELAAMRYPGPDRKRWKKSLTRSAA
jgi:hypothetical protein